MYFKKNVYISYELLWVQLESVIVKLCALKISVGGQGRIEEGLTMEVVMGSSYVPFNRPIRFYISQFLKFYLLQLVS